jgi:hypothetical protein
MKHRTGWLIGAAGLLAGLALGTALRLPTPAALGIPAERAGDLAREVLATSDPLERSIRWGALLERSGSDAVQPLHETIAASPLDIGDLEVISFAMWWARFDPNAALAWTSAEWRAQSNFAIGQIFRMWAHADPEAAFKAIGQVPELRQDAALDAVVTGWHESGKPGLVEYVQSIPADAIRQRAGESLARHLVLALGTEAAMRWLETVGDPSFRQTMSMRIASAAAAQGDAAAAATWATPQVSAGKAHLSGFPRRIGTRWILRDPPAALAWLASLPAGNDRNDGVAESFRDWLRYTPGAALQWIQNAELEPWSEPAFSIYALRLAGDDPKQGLDLASRFSDADLRNRTIVVIARAWATQDAKAAQAWLAQADLPADVRQRASAQVRAPLKKPVAN